jgi:alkanesulfonate monooxygenase SsuD/methylene tetrahydromethanopterin reductase-like flavin-dependent oxidoreductase (luciferase family)
MLVTVMIDDNVSPEQIPAEMSQRMVVGMAESVADQLKTKVLDAGINGLIINLPAYAPGVVTKAAEALRPLISRD